MLFLSLFFCFALFVAVFACSVVVVFSVFVKKEKAKQNCKTYRILALSLSVCLRPSKGRNMAYDPEPLEVTGSALLRGLSSDWSMPWRRGSSLK